MDIDLRVWLQDLILDYIKNNQNCDSSKFRQQMFSSLKKLLLNVRDSRSVFFFVLKKYFERTTK